MSTRIFFVSFLLIIGIVSTSYKAGMAPRKLYPEITAFFNSLNYKQYEPSNLNALETLKYNVQFSKIDQLPTNINFYCSDNSFYSQASQVFLHTLCYAYRYKRVKIHSAGATAGAIDMRLINYLENIGYKVTKIVKEGKASYEVRYSDHDSPVTLYAKAEADASIPTKETIHVILCNKEESACAKLKAQSYAHNTMTLPPEVDSSLRAIATAMLYSVKSK